MHIGLGPQPGTELNEDVDIADEVLHPLLAELGLEGFPKTSGGRGLHVYIPLEARWDFVEVRHAGIALAREVERRSADRDTTAWWKEEQGDRKSTRLNSSH